tara:strand:+ start:121 stop:510 length:390 start_codon:yes stop_codon:yes gene_type:complete
MDGREVIFATCTDVNHRALDKTLDEVKAFVRKLAEFTKCHVESEWGVEEGNTHVHLIIAVPEDEVERFHRRVKKFRAWKAWRFKTLDFQPWSNGHGTYGYVLKKHMPLFPGVECPRYYRRCRSGACEHS